LKKEITIEDTISKNSKRTVKKYLEHDYINPNITRKKHKVDELSKNGEWKNVPDENTTYPAKLRPNKNINNKQN
jgi:hypothetical protein